jgi:hypothetical protein
VLLLAITGDREVGHDGLAMAASDDDGSGSDGRAALVVFGSAEVRRS